MAGLILLGTTIWVAFDASNIGAKRGRVAGLAGMGPAGWFFSCLLLWVVAFPLYLAKRPQIRARVSLVPHGSAGTQKAAPGWLPDPTGRHDVRYWDGQQWSRHVMDDDIPSTDLATMP